MSIDKHKPLVLILAFSNFSNDPRVMRQIEWLKIDYRLILSGYSSPKLREFDFINISVRKSKIQMSLSMIKRSMAEIPGLKKIYRQSKELFIKLLRLKLFNNIQKTIQLENINAVDSSCYRNYYINKIANVCNKTPLLNIAPDLILANDLDCLFLARWLWPSKKVVFDAHEYAPKEYSSDSDYWIEKEQPARYWACKNLLPTVSGMTTVCSGIAEEFKSNFELFVNIEIVTNSPAYENIKVRNVADSTIKLIHHGIGSPLRKLEVMADVVIGLGAKWDLTFILVEGDAEYIKKLKKEYSQYSNIHFHNPVRMPEIAQYISQFDIGIFILDPFIFNYKWALPNKFFEFIQARLAIAIGPSPEMAVIVADNDLGVIASDFSSDAMISALKGLQSSQINAYKLNSDKAAHYYCAENNKQKFISVVQDALIFHNQQC